MAKSPVLIFSKPAANYDALPEDVRQVIIAQYVKATASEKLIINFMLGKMSTPEQVMHFFLGAHIELRGDKGTGYSELIEELKKLGTLGYRYWLLSSHKSIVRQYSFAGEDLLKHVLFGKREDTEQYTWIQLEGNQVNPLNMAAIFRHGIDYIYHKWHKVNVSQWGYSTYTEARPLVIDVSTLTLEQERANLKQWQEVFLEHLAIAPATCCAPKP